MCLHPTENSLFRDSVFSFLFDWTLHEQVFIGFAQRVNLREAEVGRLTTTA